MKNILLFLLSTLILVSACNETGTTEPDNIISNKNISERTYVLFRLIGDIIEKSYYQIITAASDGAIAAINVGNSLNEKSE